MKTQSSKEGMPPISNTPPGNTAAGKILFLMRSFLDMQVASVLMHLEPWLKERNGAILEVGCGAQPYRHLVPASCRYTGLDWEQAEANFKYHYPDTV